MELLNNLPGVHLGDFSRLSVEEVFSYLILSREARADRIQWDIQTAGYSKLTDEGRKDVSKRLGSFLDGFQGRKSALELVEHRERLEMIGGNLHAYGERWGRKNGRWMRWLQDQGYTPDDALRAWREWDRKETANPFWSNGENN